MYLVHCMNFKTIRARRDVTCRHPINIRLEFERTGMVLPMAFSLIPASLSQTSSDGNNPPLGAAMISFLQLLIIAL